MCTAPESDVPWHGAQEGRITVRRAGSRQHHVELGLQDPVGTRLSPAAPRGQQHAPTGAGWGLGCSRGCLQARISSNGDALCPRTVGVTKRTLLPTAWNPWIKPGLAEGAQALCGAPRGGVSPAGGPGGF